MTHIVSQAKLNIQAKQSSGTYEQAQVRPVADTTMQSIFLLQDNSQCVLGLRPTKKNLKYTPLTSANDNKFNTIYIQIAYSQ